MLVLLRDTCCNTIKWAIGCFNPTIFLIPTAVYILVQQYRMIPKNVTFLIEEGLSLCVGGTAILEYIPLLV